MLKSDKGDVIYVSSYIVYDVRIIGDSVAPHRINEATYEGYFAGMFI